MQNTLVLKLTLIQNFWVEKADETGSVLSKMF